MFIDFQNGVFTIRDDHGVIHRDLSESQARMFASDDQLSAAKILDFDHRYTRDFNFDGKRYNWGNQPLTRKDAIETLRERGWSNAHAEKLLAMSRVIFRAERQIAALRLRAGR